MFWEKLKKCGWKTVVFLTFWNYSFENKKFSRWLKKKLRSNACCFGF